MPNYPHGITEAPAKSAEPAGIYWAKLTSSIDGIVQAHVSSSLVAALDTFHKSVASVTIPSASSPSQPSGPLIVEPEASQPFLAKKERKV